VHQSPDASTSQFAATRQAGKRAPDQTGLYAREWYVNASSPPEAGVVLQVLPDAATAREADKQSRVRLPVKPVLTGFTSGPAQPFTVPGGSGATGAAFALSPTGSSQAVSYAYKTEFQLGRAVVSELVVAIDKTLTLGLIRSDVRASVHLLERSTIPSSFARHEHPTTASIVYIVVALVVIAAAVVLPEWTVGFLGRRREHRRLKAEAQARSQYLARGRRAVRGRGAPPWSQPRKR